MSRLSAFQRLLISTFIALSVTSLMLHRMNISLNLSASMPLGFYKAIKNRKNIHRGDIVAVCLKGPIAREGLLRGYLSKGHCPSGVLPIIKQVIATPKDIVKVTANTLSTNHNNYRMPQAQVDSLGFKIKRWIKNGVYSHTNGYWLYGAHAPANAWDSRYFGPVDRNQIRNYSPNIDDAEFISNIIGTQDSFQVTSQVTGQSGVDNAGSVRQTKEFIIHPDVIKRLILGEAVFVDKAQFDMALVNLRCTI